MTYHVVAQGRPIPLLDRLYPLAYVAETWLDAYTLLPRQGSISSQEGARRRLKVIRFNHEARTATYEVTGTKPESVSLRIKPTTQDALSAFLHLRTVQMRRGQAFTVPVADSGTTFDVRVTVGNREPVAFEGGTVNAWKLVPVMLDQSGRPANTWKLALWISDDGRRLPLKLEAALAVGVFRLTLREAR